MKLLNRSTWYFLIPAIIVIIISGFVQYSIVNERIINRVDKQLNKEKKLILKQLKDLENTNNLSLYKTLKSDIEIKEDFTPKSLKDKFYSTTIIDTEDGEEIPYRILEFKSIIHNQTFIVKIKKPMEETRTFIYGLVSSNTFLFAALILLTLVINRLISKKLWTPFYSTLEKLQHFNISDPEVVRLQSSKIYEFELLNSEIESLFAKITRDYKNYKNYIENVSHELQTPIAVARSKVDLLIQSPNIKEAEHKHLSKMMLSLNKLTRLNQSLILLMKIENNLFSSKAQVDLNAIVSESLSHFEDIGEIMELTIETQLSENTTILCNELLAEVLIDNLIKNAFKHNVNGGYIKVLVAENRLSITNTGKPLSTRPEFLFERFKSDSNSPDSIGLGLSIVHQICKNNGFLIKYTNNDDLHNVEIKFK